MILFATVGALLHWINSTLFFIPLFWKISRYTYCQCFSQDWNNVKDSRRFVCTVLFIGYWRIRFLVARINCLSQLPVNFGDIISKLAIYCDVWCIYLSSKNNLSTLYIHIYIYNMGPNMEISFGYASSNYSLSTGTFDTLGKWVALMYICIGRCMLYLNTRYMRWTKAYFK